MTHDGIVFIVLGIMIYGLLCATIGSGMFLIWRIKMEEKLPFWEIPLSEGLRIYYHRIWNFITFHRPWFAVIKILLWPVVMPIILAIMSNAIERYENRELVCNF